MPKIFVIQDEYFHIHTLKYIIKNRPKLHLSKKIENNIILGSDYINRKVLENTYIYGVNTGFGSLCETSISQDNLAQLQYNHIISHACGVGKPAVEEICALTLLLKILTYRTGNTGICLSVVHRMLDFWNNNIIPVIPQKGTVGASGDLAPLAHMALPLLGLGEVFFKGKIFPSAQILKKMQWQPLTLTPKDGLALTNGVQYITATAAFCIINLEELIKSADVISAFSIQAFSCSNTFFDKLYHSLTFHQERKTVAENLSKLLEGSNHYYLETSNKSKQDPYSFRCIPQVHGAIRQFFNYVTKVIEQEYNGVSDNPLFFPLEDKILLGGNLHGESTAISLDLLAITCTELSSISERRTYQLLSGQRGLPNFLINQEGLNSGLMVAQYTSAALVNQSKVLSTPASVDSIPTCQLQEDHVSMGGTAAYKLCEIIQNTSYVLAIELLCASQAIHFNKDLTLSSSTHNILDDYRQKVPIIHNDVLLSSYIEKSYKYLIENQNQWFSLIQ